MTNPVHLHKSRLYSNFNVILLLIPSLTFVLVLATYLASKDVLSQKSQLAFSSSLLNSQANVMGKTATSSPTRSKRTEIRQRIENQRQLLQEKREAIKQRVQEKRATRSARLAGARKQRIRSFWDRLKTRLLTVIARIEKLTDRIESRLLKITQNNESIETTKIQEQLEEAEDTLADAKAKIQVADESLEDTLSSDDPKADFGAIRETIKEVKDDLVEVHRILVHVIGDIKGLRVGTSGEEEATKSGTP